MSGALRSIFALFDVDTSKAVTKLGELTKSTTSAKDALATIASTAFGAFSLHGLTDFIESQIELGSVLNDTAEKLGVGTDELQRFQFAAGLAGVSGEEAGKALQFLSKNMGDALGGSAEQAKMFAELGVAMKDSEGNVRELGDVIPEVADAFEKMGSNQERTATAMKLFGKSGASLIPLLKDGSSKLKELNEEFDALGLGIDEDFIKKADEAGDRIDILKLGFRALKSHVAAELLPSITAGAKKFSEFVAWGIKLTKETHIVKEAMWGLGIASGVAAAKTVHGWTKVLGLFPKGGSLFGNLFAMGQIGLIIGALALVGGAIEDIVVWCQGGESVIGEFVTEMLGAEKAQEIVDSLNNAWAQMQPAIAELKPIIADIGVAFAKALPYAIALVLDLVKFVMAAVTSVFALGTAIKELFEGKKLFDVLEKVDNTAGSALFGKNGVLKSSTFVDLLTAPQTATGKEAGFIGPPVPPNMHVENHFEVNGAGDPQGVAKRVAGLQYDANQVAINDAANALATGTE